MKLDPAVRLRDTLQRYQDAEKQLAKARDDEAVPAAEEYEHARRAHLDALGNLYADR